MGDIADHSENGVTAVSMSQIEDKEVGPSASKYVTDDAKGDGKKKDEKPEAVGCFTLFRFADWKDIVLMVIGTIMAIATGASLPLMILVFGEMTNTFIYDQLIKNIYDQSGLANHNITLEQLQTNVTVRDFAEEQLNISWSYLTNSLDAYGMENLLNQMTKFTYFYIIIGVSTLVSGYVQTAFWVIAAERQTKKIRKLFFRAVMRQEVGWFDTHDSGELNSRLSDDLVKIHDGIGDKVANFLQSTSGCVAGLILGFVKGWKLTVVTLSISPLLVAAALIMNKMTAVMSTQELKAYAKAGAVAEEVMGAIRTVTSFGGQDRECTRYNSNLKEAARLGTRKSFMNGLSFGFMWFIIFASYGLGFWYGAKLVREESQNYDGGTILIVFFSVIIAAFSLGSAFPNLTHVATARGAAYTIFSIIDQEPSIDSACEEGKKLENFQGHVELRDVWFQYPSRPDVPVLQGLSLRVEKGQTAALVGASGCGKSTVVQLLSRFYDVKQGAVLLDGVDVRELAVPWLRRQLGVVSQEPVLFATTIEENIRYGKEGVTDAEIEQACVHANAHEFITQLPEGYSTIVGERGAQLSGGQKQRIAIARALVRDPQLLLLDEATSALDMESEAVVQEALNKASEGRTTIVIAHRLSTIKNANVIMGIKNGRVLEQGSHDELMDKQQLYHALVQNQTAMLEEEMEQEQQDVGKEEEELRLLERQLSSQDSETKQKLQNAMKKLTTARSLSAEEAKEDLRRTTSLDEEQAVRAQAEAEAAVEEKQGCCAKMRKKKEKEDGELEPPSMGRLLGMNQDQWPFLLLGCIGSLLNGGIQPAFAVLFAEILGVFAKVSPEDQEKEVNMYCAIFVGLGLFTFVTQFFQAYMFGKAGEALTMKLRRMCFRKILSFEISWFDSPSNSTGSICTRLATEASMVQGASGIRLGMMVMVGATLGISILLAFIFGWQLTLVILAFVPFIFVSGLIQMQVMAGTQVMDKRAYEEAGKISTESIGNIRTVATLTKEPMFHRMYMEKLEPVYKASLKKAHVQGFAYGMSQAVMFFAYAAAFHMGAYLVQKGVMNFEDVMKVFSAVIYGAMGVGQATAMAPDYGKAKLASAKIFALLDRESAIDALQEEGDKPTSSEGRAELRDVRFRYPLRPDVPVLRGLGLDAVAGRTLALVGSSGCGKSTVIQLLQRFYDPLLGEVVLDGHTVTSLQPAWLRRQFGIVAQEATLFDASIRSNIAYGDLSRDLEMEEIIEVAKAANIHDFIQGLPQGYDTNVGDKGTQLSGGQKQRIAIARALIRSPKVLLLDEATSALDTESEKVVQDALERAQAGRTCIVIAHRLSTIQNADLICVLHNGTVAEMGTHQELLQLQGRYYMLQKKGERKKEK